MRFRITILCYRVAARVFDLGLSAALAVMRVGDAVSRRKVATLVVRLDAERTKREGMVRILPRQTITTGFLQRGDDRWRV